MEAYTAVKTHKLDVWWDETAAKKGLYIIFIISIEFTLDKYFNNMKNELHTFAKSIFSVFIRNQTYRQQ